MSPSIASARNRISLSSGAGEDISPAAVVGAVILHALAIGALFITFATRLELTGEETPIVPVDLVTLSDVTNVKAMAKPVPKAKPAEIPAPPAPQILPTPRPTPQPQAEAAPPKPAPAEKAEPAPTPTAKPQPQKEKQKTVTQQADSLVDKLAGGGSSKAAPGDRDIKGQGDQDKMTAKLQSLLAGEIMQCWSPPIGAPRADELIVDFDLSLNPDGSVARPPQLTAESQARANRDPYTRAAAEAAERAINQCAPFNLPAKQYKQWQEISPFHFDPRAMMGQ